MKSLKHDVFSDLGAPGFLLQTKRVNLAYQPLAFNLFKFLNHFQLIISI